MTLPFLPLVGVAKYDIARSLRLNDDDSAYLSRTFGTPTDRNKWTFSAWVKRCNLGLETVIFNGGTANWNDAQIRFNASDQIVWEMPNGASAFAGNLVSSSVYRDPAAWLHLVAIYDSANATAADRMQLWVNGVRVTAFSTLTTPPLNQLSYNINANAIAHCLGRSGNGGIRYFDGYMSEVVFVDGQALTPATFAQTDPITGSWSPKQLAGLAYGNNGFWLSFANNASTTTLGMDDAGGGAGSGAGANDWTLTNGSVTAGSGNDSLSDTPTNNYNVFNKLSTVTTATLANGGLDAGASSIAIGTFGMSSGKWYWEITSTGGTTTVGLHNGSATSTATVAAGTTKGFRFDADNGTFDWTSDGTSWTSIATGLSAGPYFVYVSTAATTVASLNSGQRVHAFTRPSGYTTICAQNLPDPSISLPKKSFDNEIYTGTGAARTKTGLQFQPDLAWFKGRSGATDHALYDSARGVQKDLGSNLSTAETTQATGLTAFNADGYSTGALAKLNTSAATYVAHLWKKGVGSGVDVVTWTGNGAARTIAHSLGVAPKLIIVKRRDAGGSWIVYHANSNATPQNYYLLLNQTDAPAASATFWNNTAPTSSVFSLGTGAEVNANGGTFVAYLFADVLGFSKFGSFVGNGSADGTFIWTGFRPAFVILKAIGATGSWTIDDAATNPNNVVSNKRFADLANAESSGADVDFVSNGFKCRSSGINTTFAYIAFAEAPFKYARAR